MRASSALKLPEAIWVTTLTLYAAEPKSRCDFAQDFSRKALARSKGEKFLCAVKVSLQRLPVLSDCLEWRSRMNRKTFKYRIYPTRSQERKLQAALDVCRGLYNSFLHDRKFSFGVDGKAPTEREQEKKIAQWKAAHPELSTVHAHLLQNVAKRVEFAFDSYFRRLEDYQLRKQAGKLKKDEKCQQPPRKKGRGVYDSLTWKQYGNGGKVEQNSVVLSKIGTIKAVIHRPLCGNPKTLTVKRQGGKWFATLSCEIEEEPLPVSLDEVGIDVGIEKFAALSTGEFIANPRFFRTDEKELAKAQRKFDKVKHKHRSKKRRKAKKAVTRINERIKNRRHNFHHQEARKIVNRFGLIAVEALDVSNMSASPAPKLDEETGQFLPNGHAAKAGLNKSILDAERGSPYGHSKSFTSA
jgi:putative transposase